MLLLALSVIGLALVAAGLIFMLRTLAAYNELTAARRRCSFAFSQVSNGLRNWDERVGRLLDAARPSMRHERRVLDAVSTARTQCMAALKTVEADLSEEKSMRLLEEADVALTGAIERLLVISGSYPEFRSSAATVRLLGEIAEARAGVASSAQDHGDAAMVFQIQIDSFPTFLISTIFPFKKVVLPRFEPFSTGSSFEKTSR